MNFEKRTNTLQQRITEKNIDFLLLTDQDSILYFSGFWGYLGIEFGRPTIFIVPRDGDCTLITPALEAEMASTMSWIEDIQTWKDGIRGEWGKLLHGIIGDHRELTIGIEQARIPQPIIEYLRENFSNARIVDATDIIMGIRIIKSTEEIVVMRQAGEVAISMAQAGVEAIAVGVPEYEVALAVLIAGTRKAADFIEEEDDGQMIFPAIHGLQIMQSGHETSMVHRRSTIRRIRHGDPVYLCFCGVAKFRQLKLGFDRQYFMSTVSDKWARIYNIALQAQEVALEMIRPDVIAEDIATAIEELYREAGFDTPYRIGRGIGYSFLEPPEIKRGDKTCLQPGMTLAVDGAITIPGEFGARVGDSIVVTNTGYELLTPYPKELRVL
jgi:Xaa-Pro aminopeptidase